MKFVRNVNARSPRNGVAVVFIVVIVIIVVVVFIIIIIIINTTTTILRHHHPEMNMYGGKDMNPINTISTTRCNGTIFITVIISIIVNNNSIVTAIITISY